MPPESEPELIAVADAALRLGVGPQYVRKLLAAGRLHGRRLGSRAWVVDGADLERFEQERRPAGRPPAQREADS